MKKLNKIILAFILITSVYQKSNAQDLLSNFQTKGGTVDVHYTDFYSPQQLNFLFNNNSFFEPFQENLYINFEMPLFTIQDIAFDIYTAPRLSYSTYPTSYSKNGAVYNSEMEMNVGLVIKKEINGNTFSLYIGGNTSKNNIHTEDTPIVPTASSLIKGTSNNIPMPFYEK
ncbi:hypothetical protein [Flammeovirga kamogawensis]|uniref:DUF4251 domain-containing protein n=1 Tax=Flammeovirga kamogawensis TaxID=373891 RepID=A0ABX8H4M4_9BACT|nr:hypothetical protein [Flammeovirga kamogawensis]MBB6463143.1 hypothetical protein [Flammeovirga kamogawensis]QWG10377.1 hypothetical protein KM029_25720 [Flammeovirga kamogawensis]TRX63887.1 hypothetical protein EO216_26095 [Flammeovirga kamogawensis]